MPKATWGSGDQALTAADIDGVDTSQQFKPYAGEVPPSGLYRFVVRRLRKGESGQGNPKLTITCLLDGTWKPRHQQYEGAPLVDHMPMMKSTAFRARAFTDALGVSSADLIDRMVVDEQGRVEKIGKLKLTGDELVYINVRREPGDSQNGPRIVLNGTGYLPVDDFEQDGEAEADAADEDAPF